MKRALLTGGAGFIGRALADALTARGWSARALDNLHAQVHHDPERSVEMFSGEVVAGDVRDEFTVSQAVRGCDAVVHLAAETGVGQSMYEAARYESTNVAGSAHVARAAVQEGAALVLFSSRAVYGEGAYACPKCGITFGARCCDRAAPRAACESDPLLPVSVYGETKLRAEAVVREGWPQNLPLLVLRPQNVVGVGHALTNPYTGVLAAFAARLQARLPMQVFGTGTQTRDIVHVADVVDLVAWGLEERRASHHPLVLNVGTGRRTTLDELARAAARAKGDEPARLEHVDIERPGDIEHACADMTAASRSGAPLPRRPSELAVREFMFWALRQPAASPRRWEQALEDLAANDLLRQRGE